MENENKLNLTPLEELYPLKDELNITSPKTEFHNSEAVSKKDEENKNKRIKKDIASSNLVPIINMGFSMLVSAILPFLILAIYYFLCAYLNKLPDADAYSGFVTFFFGEDTVVGMLINMFIYALIMSSGPLVFWIINRKKPFGELIGFKKVSFSKYIYTAVIAIGASLVFNAVASGIGAILTLLGVSFYEPDFTPSAANTSLVMSILYLINISVLPAIFEEFAYRGFAISSIRKKAPYLAIILSGITFGLMHGTVSQIPGSIVFGTVIAYFVVKFDCIWLGVFTHFLNNFLVSIPYLTDTLVKNDAIASATDVISTMIFTAIFVASFILVRVFLSRHGFKIKASSDGVSGKESFKLLFKTPAFYIMLGISVLTFVSVNFM